MLLDHFIVSVYIIPNKARKKFLLTTANETEIQAETVKISTNENKKLQYAATSRFTIQ